MRPTTRALAAILFVLALSAVLLACVVGGGLYVWARQDAPASLDPLTAIRLKIRLAQNEEALRAPAGGDDAYRRFEVQRGEGAGAIAANLVRVGLLRDADLFVDYARFYGLDSQLEAGTYFLQQTQTLEEIAYALTDASVASLPFRIIAGWRLEELAQLAVEANTRLDFGAREFMQVVGPGAPLPPDFQQRVGIPAVLSNGQPPSLEGFLFPDDYRLQPGITPGQLRDVLLENFQANVTEAMFQQAAAQGLTMYQVVTLASIVQREAAVMDEAPTIASVYLNRMRLPMRLDADPTVQYAIGNTRDGRWWPNITQDDYYGLNGVPNQSYSTYLNEGLPPGPIASPGLGAIRAVLDAPTTDYFYFRLGCGGDGRHAFFTRDQQTAHAAFTCP